MNLNPNSPLSSPVSLDNLVTSLCLCFLIYKMGENIAPISRGAVMTKSHNIPVDHLEACLAHRAQSSHCCSSEAGDAG